MTNPAYRSMQCFGGAEASNTAHILCDCPVLHVLLHII